MVDSNDNIPTLTNIVHPGDESMANHFDAHEFDDDAADVEIKIESENDIPSISMPEETQPPLPDDFTNDFSEAMQLDNSESSVSESDNLDMHDLDLKEKIDQAVTAILPEIENLLKEKLYKQLQL